MGKGRAWPGSPWGSAPCLLVADVPPAIHGIKSFRQSRSTATASESSRDEIHNHGFQRFQPQIQGVPQGSWNTGGPADGEKKPTVGKGKQAGIFVLKNPVKILSAAAAQLTPRCIIRDNYQHRKPHLNQKDAATTITQTNPSTHRTAERILLGMKGNTAPIPAQNQPQPHCNSITTNSITVQNNVSRHSQELVNKFPSPQLTRPVYYFQQRSQFMARSGSAEAFPRFS
ncbi:hypothetical protein Anapl_17162 [Anas platyrhynchos]|uniref:Uncharacterized protein n=1 Tax=Anas platyrhynchos TaxID=8839 RepID=R0J9F1_ANAPL|nr:hypothetical protein Anapl_17162 [Anas platyrhynchos]